MIWLPEGSVTPPVVPPKPIEVQKALSCLCIGSIGAESVAGVISSDTEVHRLSDTYYYRTPLSQQLKDFK